MTDFRDLGLSKDVLRAVHKEGYELATPIQIQAIPEALAGRDLMGNAQTGTGKTAAFAMPVLERLRAGGSPPRGQPRGRHREFTPPRRIRALVLAPTRELAAQIGASFSAYGRFTGLRNTVIFGGVGQGPQVQAIKRGIDILVATPGRLEDLMGQRVVSLRDVEILILDEADHMLDIGFIHALRRIVKTVPASRQTLMFSATMPNEIRRLAKEWLNDPVHVQVDPVSTPAEDVEQSVYYVEKKQKPRLLAALLKELPRHRSLVFTRTKYGADKVVKLLKREGLEAAAIHGNKSQGHRQRVLAQFKSHRITVLVATDIAARGLDIDGITHVFNVDLPEVAEVYVHRIGRTGRAGATGIAISFCAREEVSLLRAITRLTKREIRREETPTQLQSQEAPPARVGTARAARANQPRQRGEKENGRTPRRGRQHHSKDGADSKSSETRGENTRNERQSERRRPKAAAKARRRRRSRRTAPPRRRQNDSQRSE